jgi:peptidoglycan/xylan/chitin deacetylase (PgdA/CDA1 family)
MIKNFLFHRVNPIRDPLWDPMDVALFDRCIKYISGNYRVGLLEDIVLHTDEFTGSGKNIATIVFDDGYRDNIEYALPVLEKYKVKASFYVVTDCIENNIPPWTYVLDYSFKFTAKNKIELPYEFLPEHLRIRKLKDLSARIEFVKKLKPALKKIKHNERNQVLQSVLQSFDDIKIPGLMMNWNDLGVLKGNGHTIGSHTVTHSMLGTMDNEEEIRAELLDSARAIEQRLGHFPVTISYPVGSYNETTMRLSRETGYKIGVAVRQEVYDPEKHGVFEVPRIELYNEPWLKTRLRIDNIIGKLSKLLRRV